MSKKSNFFKIAVVAVSTMIISACATYTNLFGEPDDRWVDYKSWTKITEGRVVTGDATGLLGGLHLGEEGYREVYVNDIGLETMKGTAPYLYPEGTVVVKEQYKNKEAWEKGYIGGVTIMVKVSHSGEVNGDDWRYATSYKGSLGKSDFCAGCHLAAFSSDLVFTNEDLLSKHK